MKDSVNFTVNGLKYSVVYEKSESLLDILRDHLGLMGTKEGCGYGECGSCTVIMDNQVVHSCLVPASQVDGTDVWTIEGLTPQEGLHPMQEAFLNEGAVQCGYCTPGFIIAGVALLRRNSNPSENEIKEAISGNLCRCTGYHKIVRAIQVCADEIRTSGVSL